MGRIFISAAHGGIEAGKNDPGAVAGGTTEAKEMILLRDLVVIELRARNLEVLAVPDDLSAAQTVDWINSRANNKDIAIEIQANATSSPSVRGASASYIAKNDQRKQNAETVLTALLRRVPQLPNRGAKPDTDSGLGNLQFCRQTAIAAIILQVCFLSSPEDRALLQGRRRDFAIGIMEGLASWSQANDPQKPKTENYPSVNININGQNYSEQGVLINGNAYIPIDLVDCLRIDISKVTNLRRITYRQIVYIKAIELRDSHVSINWDSVSRTVKLRSILAVCPGQIEKIISNGNTSELQLQLFLKTNNENAIIQFSDIPKLYREEATIEGVNHDIAFSQMCLETGFLRFGTDIKPQQNNFACLGTVGGGLEGASFPSARIGVRAHIQHLKAYASLEPLVQQEVDPRFRFVTRGVASSVHQLSGRWSADLDYGTKIVAILKRLHESANLF